MKNGIILFDRDIKTNGKNINKNTIGLRDFLTDMILGGGEGFEKFISIARGDNTSINKDYETTIEYDEFASEFDKITIYLDILYGSSSKFASMTKLI